MASYLQELRDANDKQLQEIFDKETDRVTQLSLLKLKKEEQRKSLKEQQSNRAQLAAQGVIGNSGSIFRLFFFFTVSLTLFLFNNQIMPISRDGDQESKHGVF